jgi:hypothetical protein
MSASSMDNAAHNLDRVLQSKEKVEEAQLLQSTEVNEVGFSIISPIFAQLNNTSEKAYIKTSNKNKNNKKRETFQVIFLDTEEDDNIPLQPGVITTQEYTKNKTKNTTKNKHNIREKNREDNEIEDKETKDNKIELDLQDNKMESELDALFKKVIKTMAASPQFHTHKEVKREDMRPWYRGYINFRISLFSILQAFSNFLKYNNNKKGGK